MSFCWSWLLILMIWLLSRRRKYIWNQLISMWKVWKATKVKEYTRKLKEYFRKSWKKESSRSPQISNLSNNFKNWTKLPNNGKSNWPRTESSSQKRTLKSFWPMAKIKIFSNFSWSSLHQLPRNFNNKWKINNANFTEKTTTSTV